MGHERLAAPDLERIFQGETVAGLSEWQLLTRYLEHRDELAFAALVARHGPMVMGTCRRMLSRGADAEDAFQATFLVLVRRARSLGPRDAIGPWLHGVAARVSMRARSQAARRTRVEPDAGELTAVPDWRTSTDGEVAAILDQEVSRLPDKYRSPVVLCYLEGLTHEDAARQLNWPVGSVKGRLARARDLLRSRLLRRGIAPAAAILGSSIGREASAAFNREVFEQTVSHCMSVTLGHATVDAVSVSIGSLVKGALSAMIIEKVKWAGFAALATGLALAGAVVMARQAGPEMDRAAKARAIATNRLTGAAPAAANGPGEKGKAAEMESSEVENLRNRLIQAALRDWTASLQDFRANKASLDRVYQASTRLLSAEQNGRGAVADQAAASAHAQRMRDLARIENENPSRTESQVSQVNAFSAEAELWMSQASARFSTAGKAAISTSPRQAAGGKDNSNSGDADTGTAGSLQMGHDARSLLIIKKLDEPVTMKFDEETPLEEVIKHIKDSTKSSDMPGGIPIYVDPIGLSEADKTMSSTVRNMYLEGVPLRRTLQLLLTQLDLFYFVVDGMLYITSTKSQMGGAPLPPAIPVATALSAQFDKADRGELTLDEMKNLVEMLKTQKELDSIRAGVVHDVVHSPTPPPTEEAIQNKQLVESLSKLTQSLIEEVKELRKAKQPEKPGTPAAPATTPKAGVQ
jgi:RNA polymerase sigma factor (sigma-70 family)